MDTFSARIVDPTNQRSLSSLARQRRWEMFVEAFPDVSEMRVLDLGGTPAFWTSAPVSAQHVTVVNLQQFESADNVVAVQGDACSPPPALMRESFDLVVSNSLIEHVGGHAQRARLADTIRRASARHWVQTPYRYFPIEPHWMFPALQFLPFRARVEVTTRWKFGNRYTRDRQKAIDHVHEVELLGGTQMADYFPDSIIWREKFAGLVKSLVAISA